MDSLTALISCSPIKSHPDTALIDQCIASIQERTKARIIVMADGVREEQEDYRERYQEFLKRLRKEHPDVEVFQEENHAHQARTTRDALLLVDTPVILFIEHDMALSGDIPIEEICQMIREGQAHVIRLLYEDNDLLNFTHLLRAQVGDYTQTMQWSNRPHFADTAYYKNILHNNFSPASKTFIEDRMHGVIDTEDNWEQNKLWVYTPEPPVNRFIIHDGREDDPKWDELLIY